MTVKFLLMLSVVLGTVIGISGYTHTMPVQLLTIDEIAQNISKYDQLNTTDTLVQVYKFKSPNDHTPIVSEKNLVFSNVGSLDKVWPVKSVNDTPILTTKIFRGDMVVVDLNNFPTKGIRCSIDIDSLKSRGYTSFVVYPIYRDKYSLSGFLLVAYKNKVPELNDALHSQLAQFSKSIVGAIDRT